MTENKIIKRKRSMESFGRVFRIHHSIVVGFSKEDEVVKDLREKER